jgi:sulfatase modifying factor 1
MKRFLITSLVLALSLGVGRLAVAGAACANENGDGNGDGGIDLSDAIYMLTHLFQGGDGPVDFCFAVGPKVDGCANENGDVNGDGGKDLSDAIYSLTFSFQGGDPPAPPCAGGVEVCGDGFDNDGDNDIDCDDADCDADPRCIPETDCDDNIDNDFDGKTDCADGGDCKYIPPCSGTSPCDGMTQLDLTNEGFTYVGVNIFGCHEYDRPLPAAAGAGGGAGSGRIPADTMRFVLLPAGSFTMGSPETEAVRGNADDCTGLDTELEHTVNISSFLMGKYEVTQGQLRHILDYNKSPADGLHCIDGTCGGTCQEEYDLDEDGVLSTAERDAARAAKTNPEAIDGVCPDLPASNISRLNLVNFDGFEIATTVNGRGLKLPTEAQWEYACRGGKQLKYGPGNGLDLANVAWTAVNSDLNNGTLLPPLDPDTMLPNEDALHRRTAQPNNGFQEPHPVGTKRGYGYGLYDTHGNVFEWVLDASNTGAFYAVSDGFTDPFNFPPEIGDPQAPPTDPQTYFPPGAPFCKSLLTICLNYTPVLPDPNPLRLQNGCPSCCTCNSAFCGVYRGGSFLNNQSCFVPVCGEAHLANDQYRSAHRSANNPGNQSMNIGFRCAFYPLP